MIRTTFLAATALATGLTIGGIAFHAGNVSALNVGPVSAQDKKELAFVVNGASDFWKLAEAGVRKAQGELPDYDLQFKYPEQAAAAIQKGRRGSNSPTMPPMVGPSTKPKLNAIPTRPNALARPSAGVMSAT